MLFNFHQFYLLSSLSFPFAFSQGHQGPVRTAQPSLIRASARSHKTEAKSAANTKGRFAANCDVSAAETEGPQLQPRTPASASFHTHSTSSLQQHCSARPFLNHCCGLICPSHKVNRCTGGLQKKQKSPVPHNTPTSPRKHRLEEQSKKQIPAHHSH